MPALTTVACSLCLRKLQQSLTRQGTMDPGSISPQDPGPHDLPTLGPKPSTLNPRPGQPLTHRQARLPAGRWLRCLPPNHEALGWPGWPIRQSNHDQRLGCCMAGQPNFNTAGRLWQLVDQAPSGCPVPLAWLTCGGGLVCCVVHSAARHALACRNDRILANALQAARALSSPVALEAGAARSQELSTSACGTAWSPGFRVEP